VVSNRSLQEKDPVLYVSSINKKFNNLPFFITVALKDEMVGPAFQEELQKEFIDPSRFKNRFMLLLPNKTHNTCTDAEMLLLSKFLTTHNIAHNKFVLPSLRFNVSLPTFDAMVEKIQLGLGQLSNENFRKLRMHQDTLFPITGWFQERDEKLLNNSDFTRILDELPLIEPSSSYLSFLTLIPQISPASSMEKKTTPDDKRSTI
jgi:hypothetical protein